MCRNCYQSWLRVNRRENFHGAVGHDRKRSLKNRYGLSVADYEAMLAAQGGVCAICGQPDSTGRRLSVDHDHNTGAVRGLLCSHCNRGIGHFKDSTTLLARAIEYLANDCCSQGVY
jgi:hypothetical protein